MGVMRSFVVTLAALTMAVAVLSAPFPCAPGYRDPIIPIAIGDKPGSNDTAVGIPPSLMIKKPANFSRVWEMSGPDRNLRIACPFVDTSLRAWHDNATWPRGSVPIAGKDVILPDGVKVLVSSCSWPPGGYRTIIVPPTSELIFDDAPMSLQLRNIRVMGKMSIGSRSCRYFSQITFTFTGPVVAPTVHEIGAGYGAKGIAVTPTGFLDIHGRQYFPTWTRLAVTVTPNATNLWLQRPVNWVSGQQIALLTTIYEDEKKNQNEVRTITGVGQNGTLIQVDRPFQFYHYAGSEYQAEVMLLSRSIVFNGNGTANGGFGGHIYISGKARISGVELVEMGQTNIIGRYPLHLHQTSNNPDSYFADNSVHRSQFRCYVLHGTNQAQVLRNTAFDVKGNCITLEEGIETFAFNLAAFVHPLGRAAAGIGAETGEKFTPDKDAVHPADHAASPFFITNAFNNFIGNAASGGWAGFNFVNLYSPIGLSRNVSIVPADYTTLIFDGNSAHSAGYTWEDGACIYFGGMLQEVNGSVLEYSSGRVRDKPQRNTQYASQQAWLVLQNTRVWMCNVGLLHWGHRIDFEYTEIHDSIRGVHALKQASLVQAWLNADSGNVEPPPRPSGTAVTRGIQFFDNMAQVILADVTFQNYVAPNVYAMASQTFSDAFKTQGIIALTRMSYVNTPTKSRLYHDNRPLASTGSSRQFNFVDFDGSTVNARVKSLVGALGDFNNQSWWKVHELCTNSSDWSSWICTMQTVEVASVDVLVKGFNDFRDPKLKDSYVGKVYIFGGGGDVPKGNVERSIRITQNRGLTGPVGAGGWYFAFDKGSPKDFRLDPQSLPWGRSLIVALRYPNSTVFTITRNAPTGQPLTRANSYQTFLEDPNGSMWFFDGNHLFLKAYENISYIREDYFYRRGGAHLWNFYNTPDIVVKANCGGTDWCNAPFLMPSLTGSSVAESVSRDGPYLNVDSPSQNRPPLLAFPKDLVVDDGWKRPTPRDFAPVLPAHDVIINTKEGAATDSSGSTLIFTGTPYETKVTVSVVDLNRVRFTVSAKHTGWIGLGFPSVANLMANSDVILGWAAPNASSIKDYNVGKMRTADCVAGGLCPDRAQNLENATVTEVNGTTTITFVRQRSTGDSNDAILYGGPTNIIVALGPYDWLSYHGTNRTGAILEIPKSKILLPPPPQTISPPGAPPPPFGGWYNLGESYQPSSYSGGARITIAGVVTSATAPWNNSRTMRQIPFAYAPKDRHMYILMGANSSAVIVEVVPGIGSGPTSIQYVGQGAGTGFISFDGIMYTRDSTAPLSLSPGFTQSTAPNFAKGGYLKVANLVILQGLVRATNLSYAARIATLPAGFRPPFKEIFPTFALNTFARVDVAADGTVSYLAGPGGQGWVNLDNIHFLANGTNTVNVGVTKNWTRFSTAYSPFQAGLSGSTVSLRGVLRPSNNFPSGHIGSLPLGYRPASRRIFIAACAGFPNTASNTFPCRVEILSTGVVGVVGRSAPSLSWISFSGIAYDISPEKML